MLQSATEPFDTGAAAGRMMLQMPAVFAEFEHATIVDRISAGNERRAMEGRLFGGRPPFGYTFSSEDRVLVPDPVKAPVVQRVFDLYARKRLGTRTIAQRLRDDGVPAPSAGWGHPAIRWIINNPTYVGKIRRRDRVFDGVHEPLVDEFTFAKAQTIMHERGEHAKRRGNGGRYHYYACTGRQKDGPKACEITRAEQSLERYSEAFEQGKLSPERCETRLQRLQARLDDLHAQQAELSLQAPDEGTHAPTAADLADLLEDVLAEADPQKTKPLLRRLIDELRVNSRTEILPTYRLVTPLVCAMTEKVEAAGIEPP